MVSPQPGKAICLQFLTHGQRIGLRLRGGPLSRRHPVRYAQKSLYMMAYLMCYDIGLGEVAVRSVTLAQVFVEGQVRSEERRVGKECRSRRSRSPDHRSTQER